MDQNTFFESLLFPPDSNLGNNEIAVTHLWKVLQRLEQNGNEITQNIVTNFLEVRENIQIFNSAKDSRFLKFFQALEIDQKADDMVLVHELGHFYFNILINQEDIIKNFPAQNERAKEHCKSIKETTFKINNKTFNNSRFRFLIEELCTNKQKENAELSDIISAIWLGLNSFQNPEGKVFSLPYVHSYDYYHDEGKTNYILSFDEQFANFFALFVTNKQEKLEILRTFCGEEWFTLMMNTLLQIEAILIERKEQRQTL